MILSSFVYEEILPPRIILPALVKILDRVTLNLQDPLTLTGETWMRWMVFEFVFWKITSFQGGTNKVGGDGKADR